MIQSQYHALERKIADLTVKYNTFTNIKGMFTKKK